MPAIIMDFDKSIAKIQMIYTMEKKGYINILFKKKDLIWWIINYYW
jgi:hypothetical protein